MSTPLSHSGPDAAGALVDHRGGAGLAPAQPTPWRLVLLHLRANAVLPMIFALVLAAQILVPVVIMLSVGGEDSGTVTAIEAALMTWTIIVFVAGIVETSSQTRLHAVVGATRVRMTAAAWVATVAMTAIAGVLGVAMTALGQALGGNTWNRWSDIDHDGADLRVSGVVTLLPDHPAAVVLPALVVVVAAASAGRLIGSAYREWSAWAATPFIVVAVAPVAAGVVWYYTAGIDGGVWAFLDGTPTWWVPVLVAAQTAGAWIGQTRGRLSTAA